MEGILIVVAVGSDDDDGMNGIGRAGWKRKEGKQGGGTFSNTKSFVPPIGSTQCPTKFFITAVSWVDSG